MPLAPSSAVSPQRLDDESKIRSST